MLAAMGIHDKLIERGTTLERVQGAVAKAFGTTADEINRANQAGQGYSPKSMQVAPATPKGDENILDLKQRNELLKIQGERLRAVTKAGMEQAKVTNNPNQIEAAKRLAGENYDLQQAEDARKQAASKAESQAKSFASSADSDAQKLDALRQKSAQVADSTKEMSRAQAILQAQQSLSKNATPDMIQQAGDYAAKIWDQNNALKQQAQIKQGKNFANQEIAAGQASVNPLTGETADPTAIINQQEQKKLAALATYQELDKQNTQLYEDAKTAIQLQASNARQQIAMDEAQKQQQATSSILSSASSGFGSLASIIENSSSRSNAAYQVMFAASKAFAIAQSTMALGQAAIQAMADPTALTPAQKLANYALIAGAGASLLSNVASISYGGGREHGGPVSASSMYRVGEGGKPEIYKASNGNQYMIPGDNGRVLSNKDLGSSGGGGNTIHQTIQVNGNPDDRTLQLIQQAASQGAQQGARMVASDVAQGTGMVSKALRNGWTTKRRAG